MSLGWSRFFFLLLVLFVDSFGPRLVLAYSVIGLQSLSWASGKLTRWAGLVAFLGSNNRVELQVVNLMIKLCLY